MHNNDLRLAAFLLFVAALILAALLGKVLLSDPGAAMRQEGFLEAIVVTTQKREQSVQEVPIAARVLNSAKFELSQAISLEGRQQLIPTVLFKKDNSNRNSGVV